MNDPAKSMSTDLTSAGIKRRFDMLSHDLRTAVGGITGNLQLLETSDLDPDSRKRVRAAQTSAEHLSRFLDDLAAGFEEEGLAELDTPIELERLSPDAFVERIGLQWDAMVKAAGMELEISTEQALPQQLMVDTYRTARIIGNIVQNSIKYAGQGSVHISLDCPQEHTLSITITDEGPGFTDKALGSLFSYSGRPVRSGNNGSGLGLHIARNLTSDLNGTIDATNRARGGAKVVLTLPIIQPGKTASVAVMPNTPLPDLSGLRILLVEDNATNQMVVAQMLDAMGADYRLASDGLEGLSLIDVEPFDLALVDIEMPRLSGLDLIRKVRGRNDARARLPLVAFTAYAMREHRNRINEAGADGLIAKPVTGIEDFGNAILRHLPEAHRNEAGNRTTQAQRAAATTKAETDEQNSAPVVEEASFNALVQSVGPETMAELLRRVEADLIVVQQKIIASETDENPILAREASHVLISVAGAIGATNLQHKAQRLNTHCHGGNSKLIRSASEECLSGIDLLLDYVRNTTL